MSRLVHKDTSPHSLPLVDNIHKPFTRPFNKNRKTDNPTNRPTTRMASPAPSETCALLKQNQELRQKLQDESSNYRRRLDTYKQAQQNQAALVGRLQAKVLQYKQRCIQLETHTNETILPCDSSSFSISSPANQNLLTSSAIPLPMADHNTSGSMSLPYRSVIAMDDIKPFRDTHDTQYRNVESYDHRNIDNTDEIVKRLDEEKLRCDHLLNQNGFLRQQLEESNRTNEALTNDLQKLTNDWEIMRDEMVSKEDEWKEEEQAFNDYYNNEHNRLLRMWRDVVSFKRTFKDMACSMKTDITKMHCEIGGVAREATNAINGVSVSLRHCHKVGEINSFEANRENETLKNQLLSIHGQYEMGKIELAQREQRIQQLLQDLKNMEHRCHQAENQTANVQRLHDEIERMNSAFRDISHALASDSDCGIVQDMTESVTQHLHLSQNKHNTTLTKRHNTRSSQAFMETTISGVQNALHKYQLMLHDMQVKLSTTNESLLSTRKQLESTENERKMLATKVSELTDQIDLSNAQLTELFKERDCMHVSIEALRAEKHSLERSKADLNILVDTLNSDYGKLQNASSKLQKSSDSLDEEKKCIEMELNRVLKEKEIVELNLRAEEERTSRFKEETITLREEINKLYLSKDLLEQQRLEVDGFIMIIEKQKSDVEYELDRVTLERMELQQNLEKAASSCNSSSDEIKQLKENLSTSESERNKYQTQSTELSNDVSSLKKELISVEKQRLDLETERLTLSEKIKFLGIEKEKVEQDLNQIARERGDLSNQLSVVSRRKECLGEEVMRMRQRLEQANEMNNRLNRHLEELVKDNEEKQIVIDGNEKDMQRVQEQYASLRSEKEALEAALFDTNTTLEATDSKKIALERDLQNLLIKQESLKNTVTRLTNDLDTSERRAQDIKNNFANKATNLEADFTQKLNHLKTSSEDSIKKLQEEKEQIRVALEKRMQQALSSVESTKDTEIQSIKDRFDGMQQHLEVTTLQHEEILIRAENDKQQALLLAHRDKQAVLEKLETVMNELKVETDNGERLKREATARAEKDRTAANQMREEMLRMKAKLEEAKQKAEDECNRLSLLLNSIKEERDIAHKDIEELRLQIRLTEDRVDLINVQMNETTRKLKEGETSIDGVRKELTDTRRMLADCSIEKDKYMNTNKDLREHVKRVEIQRREQARHLEEISQKMTVLDENCCALESEKKRLTSALKETECTVVKVSHELSSSQGNMQKLQSNASQKDLLEKELQARLNNETEERERVQQELHQVKKQMSDLEINLQATRQELGRARCKTNQDEHRWHNREQEILTRLDDGRGREKRLEDQKHNLEVCLADATQQIQELKARLGGAEGRVRALEEQLAHIEGLKKDVENKLSSIAHTLRRIAGVQFDGTVSLPYRLLSPSRRYSPARGGNNDFDPRGVPNEGPIVDVDPEVVRKGVRTLMQQVAQIEREKDDFRAQLCSAKKQLQEAADQQTRNDNKHSKLQQQFRSIQEDRASLDAKLTQKISALQTVDELLKQKNTELSGIREKVTILELTVSSGAEEKSQCEDRLEKCRQSNSKLEADKHHLQDDLARCEARSSKLDLQRVALEGDIQRLQLALSEKDATFRSLQERFDQQMRNSAQLEDRCVSLKAAVDQLKERLQNAVIVETEMRAEMNNLQRERSEQGHHVLAGQDKLKHIQKSLTNSENERRILSERLDAAQNSLADVRRSQQSQQDHIQRLQEQVAELEVQKSALESQLRIVKWNQDTADQVNMVQGNGNGNDEYPRQLVASQREKSELRNRVEELTDKLRHIESEKRSLERNKFVQFDTMDDTKSGYGKEQEIKPDSNRMDIDGGLYNVQSNSAYSNFTKSAPYNCGYDHSLLDQIDRDLRMKIRRLESMLAEKDSELARCKAKLTESVKIVPGTERDTERYRSVLLQNERLLDAKELSHRQMVFRLENQITILRDQLAQEAKRRQMYILRSARAGKEMQQLRQTLGDSLRHVAHDPIDTDLLENESKRLDNAVTLSLPLSSARDYESSLSPRLK